MSNNQTTAFASTAVSEWEGILGIFVTVLGFGSLHVPIRTFSAGDGFFVQWAMSVGTLCVGFAIDGFVGFPPLQPLAVMGGTLWAIANTLSQRVISGLGIAIGLLLWSSTNCLTGWAVGRFGLFGVRKKPPENDFMNIFGLISVLFGCIFLALVSGFFYCMTVVPVFYLAERSDLYPELPRLGLAYVFSHYFGVFMMSSAIFICYTLLRHNKPLVNPEIALPSIAGGAIWGLAMAGLLTANDALGQTITYPITTTVPGIVASLWSIFYFREISGKRNYGILLFAFVFIGGGALLVMFSKIAG